MYMDGNGAYRPRRVNSCRNHSFQCDPSTMPEYCITGTNFRHRSHDLLKEKSPASTETRTTRVHREGWESRPEKSALETSMQIRLTLYPLMNRW